MPSERDVIDHLVAKHDPEAIILVGSRSDGQARAGSDWDLYILLPPDSSGIRGPVPAPDVLGGDLLDAALVRLPIDESQIGTIFGPNLQHAKILLDNKNADAAAICDYARGLYNAGRGLSPQEIEGRRHEMSRNLARMKTRSDEPGPFFEALTYVFYISHRYWYEVLHDRWSVSVHRAMPEIAERDPQFHRHLQTLIESPDPQERIRAADLIFDALFVGERAV